jgi:predicted HTH transcriptional regulator
MTDLLKVKRERWTEEEVLSLPSGEHDFFDRKSGDLLSDIKKFEADVGKALSAFANSGGGHLLLGVRDDGLFDGMPEKRGRTDTREWLSSMWETAILRRIRTSPTIFIIAGWVVIPYQPRIFT